MGTAAKSVRQAVAFLTPVGGGAVPAPPALVWFPVVGAAMGGVLGLLWWGVARVWPAGVVAALVVAADLAVTGMAHLDGAVNSADGLLPRMGRERRLEVMGAPAPGLFGISIGGAALLLRWAALFALRPSIILLVGLWAASRAAMAAITTVVPHAAPGEGGLAGAVIAGATDAPARVLGPALGDGDVPGPARPRHASRGPLAWPRLRQPGARAGLIGLVVAVPCVVRWDPLPGLAALVAGTAAATGVAWMAVRRLGGYTGDVLGAAGVALETVALVVAAARW
jgi:adenosylcobinamide-GDP ribazoletransferase